MSEKYKGKYSIKSKRKEGFDYSSEGAYFITICTANHNCEFGQIINNEIHLSEPGQIANEIWLKIPQQFSFIELNEFVIMPNHIHGILIINNNCEDIECRDAIDGCRDAVEGCKDVIEGCRDAINRVSTDNPNNPVSTNDPNNAITTNDPKNCVSANETINKKGGITGNMNLMLHNNISKVVRWFKGRSSFEIHKINPSFAWQNNFYDVIVRNPKHFDNIRIYIQTNPLNRNEDEYYDSQ